MALGFPLNSVEVCNLRIALEYLKFKHLYKENILNRMSLYNLILCDKFVWLHFIQSDSINHKYICAFLFLKHKF